MVLGLDMRFLGGKWEKNFYHAEYKGVRWVYRKRITSRTDANIGRPASFSLSLVFGGGRMRKIDHDKSGRGRILLSHLRRKKRAEDGAPIDLW
jgi:hypothetical protein